MCCVTSHLLRFLENLIHPIANGRVYLVKTNANPSCSMTDASKKRLDAARVLLMHNCLDALQQTHTRALSPFLLFFEQARAELLFQCNKF